MTNRNLIQRGRDAAAAYLERVGICVVERDWQHGSETVHIVARDSDQLVLVDVQTMKGVHQGEKQAVSTGTHRRINRLARTYVQYAGLESTTWRYDSIDLIVISDDRALLRHRRGVLGE